MAETKTWYSVSRWSNSVSFHTAEVTRETEHCIYIPRTNGKGERRESKLSEFSRWFPTKAAALDDAIALQTRAVEAQKIALQAAEKRLADLLASRTTDTGRQG